MKVVVTGGAGFIGSHIVESLLSKGYEVIVYDNLSTGCRDNLSAVFRDCVVVEGDILDYEKLKSVFAGVDYVSHMAAQLEIFRGSDDPYYDLEVNTVGTLNVLRAAKECGVKKIINASSACIYGQVNGLTSEGYYPRPNWTYGVSKLAAEKYGDIYNDYHKLPVVHLRFGITYGEREWFRRVLTIFIKRVIMNQPPVVFGDGHQVRDFIYVGDAVDFHNACLLSGAANGQAYNVGTGQGVTIKELAHEVVKASGKKLDVLFENTAEGEYSSLVPDKRRNAEELKIMLLDISKAKKDLGWEPRITLHDGIKRELGWASSNLARWDKVLYTVR